jgi:hypothetical protein
MPSAEQDPERWLRLELAVAKEYIAAGDAPLADEIDRVTRANAGLHDELRRLHAEVAARDEELRRLHATAAREIAARDEERRTLQERVGTLEGLLDVRP